MSSRDRSLHAKGTTLVELISVIAMLAFTTSVTMPLFARARIAAGETVSLSNLRQLGIGLELQVQSHRLAYPVALPGQEIDMGAWSPSMVDVSTRWESARLWPGLVRDDLPWEDEFLSTWISPGVDLDERLAEHDGVFFTSYSYSHSFVARPELWDLSVTAHPSMLKAVHTADVRSPSLKALAWDSERTYLPESAVAGPAPEQPTPILFADTHALPLKLSGAATPVHNRLNDDPRASTAPLHNTPLGVRGNDY